MNDINKTDAIIESAFIAATKKQLGRRLVACVLVGSRAKRDSNHDSDVDAVTIIRDAQTFPKMNYANLEKRFGIRIGTGLFFEKSFLDCARGGAHHSCGKCVLLYGWRLGDARVIIGKNIFRELPPTSIFEKRDLVAGLAADYWWATVKFSPSNVWRREPRRHVGIIIALCTRALICRGVISRKKKDLPNLMLQHCPDFRVVSLLRRALDRRQRWADIEHDPRELRVIRADLRKFLKQFDAFVHRGHDRSALRRQALDEIQRFMKASGNKY